MSDAETQILKALLDLEQAVASLPTAPVKPDLISLFGRIDTLTRQLPPSTDGSLLHYLHKKSYQKARLFLEGKDAENQQGNCRHVN